MCLKSHICISLYLIIFIFSSSFCSLIYISSICTWEVTCSKINLTYLCLKRYVYHFAFAISYLQHFILSFNLHFTILYLKLYKFNSISLAYIWKVICWAVNFTSWYSEIHMLINFCLQVLMFISSFHSFNLHDVNVYLTIFMFNSYLY